MKKVICILLLVIFALLPTFAHASWLIYHKPEFRGTVIDKETKEPIQGAVVAVYYKTSTYNIAGGGTRIIHTKEVLTDENGKFVIPSYTTLFSPFTTSDAAGFIIYKPGYGGYPNKIGICVGRPEDYFLVELQEVQSECFFNGVAFQFTYGVIEMPKLSTEKDRLRASPSPPLFLGKKDFPILYKLINEERKRFGLGEVTR